MGKSVMRRPLLHFAKRAPKNYGSPTLPPSSTPPFESKIKGILAAGNNAEEREWEEEEAVGGAPPPPTPFFKRRIRGGNCRLGVLWKED